MGNESMAVFTLLLILPPQRQLYSANITTEQECLNPDTGEALAEAVRKHHLPDFSNWKKHDAF